MTNDSWKAGLLGLVLVAGLCAVCPLLAAPHIPLVDPDEGKHAAIAQEMVERGNWIVPQLLGEPYFERPVFYFWAIAASLRLFGMSEAAVRLPGMLFGMLGTLTSTALVWRLLGRRTGLIAGLFYCSMVLPLALVQFPGYDAPLVTWVNLAILCFWEAERAVRSTGFSRNPTNNPSPTRKRGKRFHSSLALRASIMAGWAWTVAAGVVLGLAILTKGLAGVTFVGITYGGYLIVSKQLRAVHCRRAGLVLTLAAIIGAWWYIAMERACPGYLQYYLVGRHLLGFVTGSQPHGMEPWWYYFPVLVVGGLPWIAYLPALARDAVNRAKRNAPRDRRPGQPTPAVAGLLVCRLHALPACGAVQVRHVCLACFPGDGRAVGGCLGAEDRRHAFRRRRRWMGRTVWCTCLLGPLALPVVFALTQTALATRFPPLAWTLAVGAGLTSLLPLWTWSRGLYRSTMGLAAATVWAQLAFLFVCAVAPVAAMLSGRDLADHFNRTRQLPSRLLMVREQVGSLVFYLDRDLRSQLHLGQMASQDMGNPLPATWDANEWMVIPERYLRPADKAYNLSSLPYQRAGRFRIYRRSDVQRRRVAAT